MKNEIIHIGDGRYVHKTEEGVFEPLPPPPLKGRPYKYNKERWAAVEKVPSHSRPNKKNEKAILKATLPGYIEYSLFFHSFKTKYGFIGRKVGHPWGYREGKLAELQKEAAKQVQKDMENIKKKLELDEVAEEAMVGALTVLRNPNSQQTKLTAAKLLLEFSKTKPVAKSEVSVNAAEAWLASLADDNSKD
jgi:hypothetical protein